jgi:hypothetical protein
VDERTPHWRVPPGYEVGDEREKEPKKKVVREWKKILKEKQFDDAAWKDWYCT